MTSQDSLFDGDEGTAGAPTRALGRVQPAPPDDELSDLGAALRARWQGRLHLGTSSWHFPGWAGRVWDRPYPESLLSREGLHAYARHPLLSCVSLDRAFYRPLDEGTYARLAAQVDPAFRFVVKAPALVTDAQEREAGRGVPVRDNVAFLDADIAIEQAVRPAWAGLGERLGVMVFQLSPLPARWLHDEAALHARLDALAARVADVLAGRALAALELRDASLLTPALASLLRRHGWRCCLGLHDRMPAAEAQLPMQRALWPGDLVCRWNLQVGQRYAEARDAWAPFDRMRAEDLPTRAALARVARATLEAGHRVFITINNKAEGSAPESVVALARLLA
jgi:uncharacterized protein YecE (DUF72 family)